MATNNDYILILAETKKNIRKAKYEVDTYIDLAQRYAASIDKIDKLRRNILFYKDEDANKKLYTFFLDSINLKEELDNSGNKIRTLLSKALSESLSALIYALNRQEDNHDIHLRVRNRLLDIKEIVLSLNNYMFDVTPLISILSYVHIQLVLMNKGDSDFRYTERRIQNLFNVLNS